MELRRKARNSNMAKKINDTAIALVLGETDLPDVTAARLAVCHGEGEAQGTKRDYARILNVQYAYMAEDGGLPWFERDHKEVSTEMKVIAAERDALFVELKKPTNRLPNGHSNASAVWRMIKTYAGEEAAAAALDERICVLVQVDPETGKALMSLSEAQAQAKKEAAGDGPGANAKRHPVTRGGDELKKLYRFYEALLPTDYPAADMAKIDAARDFIAQAYVALGFPEASLPKT